MNRNKKRREGVFKPTGFFWSMFQLCFKYFVYFHVFFKRTKHVCYCWSVYILAIVFETSGGRVASSLKVFLFFPRFFPSIVCLCICFQKNNACLCFWISVHSCSRMRNILNSNLLGKPRIHCEIACLRLLNVFVVAISGKFAIMIAQIISTYTISDSLFAFV